MSNDPEFRRAIEEIKLRAPIESIVGETVELRARGRTLWACCPFHEERTPSFKIDPAEGTWYCFGACRKGGDVISYVQERGNMTFMDAVQLLSAQTGVELPRRKPRRTTQNDPGLAALAFAEDYFRRQLRSEDGRDARRYLASRGFDENAIEAFGLGWAPRNGRRLLGAAQKEDLPARALIDAGLARASEGSGELYSFFRGRLMIPIRDERGGTVGFGGRLVAGEDGPKYVNTSETRYFHKGRVIYALDRALDTVRRSGHLILVEGYTDVIAAHVAGLANVAAVLGTATTDMHAALVRRAGTRRVSLVFDGDDAGRRAAWRGLEGLLPLDLKIEVVPMPEGVDPADVLSGPDGVASFTARVETGLSWFDFVAECVEAKRAEGGRALALEVDRALELFLRLPRPVEVDTAVVDLARRLDLPVDTVRGQLRSLDARRRNRRPDARRDPGRGGGQEGPRAAGGGPGGALNGGQGPSEAPGGPPAGGPGAGTSPVSGSINRAKVPLEPRDLRAYEELVGAALVDTGLIPTLRQWMGRVPDPALGHLFQTLVDLWDNEDADITVSLVLDALGAHPVRDRVTGLVEHARNADGPQHLFEGAVEFLEQREHAAEIQRLQAQIKALEPRASVDPDAAAELERALMRLIELRRKPPSA